MDLVFGADELALFCELRRVFDPDGLANPLKILPAHACREWAGPATART